MDYSPRRKGRYEEPPRKAPWPLRVVAWLSLIVLFFALGYGGTSLLLRWMGDRIQTGVVQTTQEAQALLSGDVPLSSASGTAKATYPYYVPKGNDLEKKKIAVLRGVREDEMGKVLGAVIAELQQRDLLSPDVRLLHLFCNGDWLYLDFNKAFEESVGKLSKEQASLLITGIVRTVSEGFPPISKLKFYIESGEAKSKTPVDLTVPWTLAPKS